VTDLVERHTILAVVVGSRAYGLDGPGSDHDRRGVFAAPTKLFWRLADLTVLGADLPYVPDLIAAKREAEHGPLPAGVSALLDREVPWLRETLEDARDRSSLPDTPPADAVAALHELVVSTRLTTV